MAYEILSNDLSEDSSSSRPRKRKSHSSSDSEERSKGFSFSPIYLHIIIIIVIILGLFFYFAQDFTFNFKNEEKLSSLSLVGDIKNFNYSINSKNLVVYSADFNLEAEENTFSGQGKDFIIANFTGSIILNNKSMIIQGTAQRLEYDKNRFQLKGKEFKLVSNKKTSTNIYFENTTFYFNTGRIKLDESLNYEFKNSSIILNNYNASMSYDGTFSFLGHAQEFSLLAPNQHIAILYKE